MHHPLNLRFKGARQYVHGTDIFNESMRILAHEFKDELTNLDFQIHRMTDSDLFLKIDEPDSSPAPAEQDIAVLRFNAGQKPIQARISISATKPQVRSAYDEDSITQHCQVNHASKTISLQLNELACSPIEVIVSLTKALHFAALEKPGNTSWVFCRLNCSGWPFPDMPGKVEISLKQALGSRLTRSEINFNGKKLGQIFFSAKVIP